MPSRRPVAQPPPAQPPPTQPPPTQPPPTQPPPAAPPNPLSDQRAEVTVVGTATLRLGTNPDGSDAPDTLWLAQFTAMAKAKGLFVRVADAASQPMNHKHSDRRLSPVDVLHYVYRDMRRASRGYENGDFVKEFYGDETDTKAGRLNAEAKMRFHTRALVRARLLKTERRRGRKVYFPTYASLAEVPDEYKNIINTTLRR
jgi:hypothetical protein